VGLTEYEHRMWLEIEARLTRESRRAPAMRRAGRMLAKVLLGTVVTAAGLLLAVLVADATLAAFALAGIAGGYVLWLVAAVVVAGAVLLGRSRVSRTDLR
jgi:hypothetical protein